MPRMRPESARPRPVQSTDALRPTEGRLSGSSNLRARLTYAIGPTILLAMGATVVASAQSNSPFATDRKTQAWETPAASQPVPAVQTRSVTASMSNSTLAGGNISPGLRLRAAPRTQADAMTAKTAPKPQTKTPAPQQSTTVTPPTLSNQPSTTVRPAPNEPQPSRQVAISAPSQAPQTGPFSGPLTRTPSAQTGVQSQLSVTSQTYGQTTTSSQTYSGSQTYGTSQSASVPNRWALGSSHRPSRAAQPAFSNPSSFGVQTGSASDGAVATRRTASTGPAGSYQRQTSARTYGSREPSQDWSDYEPEPPLPGAWYPPGTGPRPDRNMDQRQVQTQSQDQFQGQNQSGAQGSSPFARQNQSQAWEQGSNSGQTAPQSPYGQPQTSPSQPQSGPFTPGPNARTPNAPPQGPYSQPQSGPYSGPYSGPDELGEPERRGWLDRIGLGGITTLIRGGLRAGVAGRENNGWKEAFIADGDIEAEASAITRNGMEWGVHTQVRAQYDVDRKGFTRRLPDCPPTLAGCASVLVAGNQAAVRGHTSQFYTFGPDMAEDTQIALESAHLFLRSAYGDVTLGRDDGAAYLFSLGAPSLLNVAASNSGVDYTGLDAVRTRNEASGFAEKITYTSPRLLGDQVGVGVQFGFSYAPDASACGVDYCVDLNDIENVVAPDIADVMEAGVALDRTFRNGLSVEGTLTYARGAEQSGLAELDDLQSFGAGVEVKLSDWTLGGSWLKSNQGLQAGDYQAYDVGLTWQPSRIGFTLGYGHATDDLVQLTSDQITGGVTFDLSERIRLGAGVQYADRETLQNVAGTAQLGNEQSTALFIEAGLKF